MNGIIIIVPGQEKQLIRARSIDPLSEAVQLIPTISEHFQCYFLFILSSLFKDTLKSSVTTGNKCDIIDGRPHRTCLIKSAASFSVYDPFSTIRSKSSPPVTLKLFYNIFKLFWFVWLSQVGLNPSSFVWNIKLRFPFATIPSKKWKLN